MNHGGMQLLNLKPGLGLRSGIPNAHAPLVGNAGERSMRFKPKFQVEIDGIQEIHETYRQRRTPVRCWRFECVPGFDEQAADAGFYVANLWRSKHALPSADSGGFYLFTVAPK